ncbi:MAG: transketolase [Candidatus Bathyarchaeia archaeon]
MEREMEKEELIQNLQSKARKLRRETLFIMKEMGSGWLGGCFSSADLVSALFFYRMRHDPKNACWRERDRFIVSKGHSCEIIYAALAESGYIPREELKTYSHLGSRLQTHVDCRTPGIDCSGGSLGLGLSFAVGSAMGAYILPHGKNLSSSFRNRKARFRVYCILGDGECNEGQVWEAAMNAFHYRLDNLTAIVDHNRFQSTGPVEAKMNPLSLAEKFKAFGWESLEIDGNNMREVVDALDWVLTVEEKPQAIIAHTIKGKGFPSLENTNCHFIKITEELMQEGLRVLGENDESN